MEMVITAEGIKIKPDIKFFLIESQYFPPVQYFQKLAASYKVYIECCENFQKQTYRNRFYILTANGVKKFTVPVTGSYHKPVKDIRIDDSNEWKNIHWRAIQSAYGKAPYFVFYEQDIYDLIYGRYKFLLDLNHAILEKFLNLLELPDNVHYTTVYKKNTDNPDFVDYRNKINPKNFEQSVGGMRMEPYNQLFGLQFEAGLSVIDLIFNEGPNAKNVITKSNGFDNNN